MYQLQGLWPCHFWVQCPVRPFNASIHLAVHMELKNVYQTKNGDINNLFDWELVSAFL